MEGPLLTDIGLGGRFQDILFALPLVVARHHARGTVASCIQVGGLVDRVRDDRNANLVATWIAHTRWGLGSRVSGFGFRA